jgi:glycosyltransferase involved in cell wall biosynthesis
MISIIIPTLNEESVLEDRLRRLRSGLTIPHEIIVSDGKSTDKTVEIARKLADKVVVYSGEKRQTIAQGRNDGARAAQGEFLAFLDADCMIPEPDKYFTKALAQFDDHKISAVVPWVKVLPEMATLSDKIVYAVFNSYLAFINNIFNLGVSGGEFQMMRRDTFNKIGGYDESLTASEDMELLGRLSKIGKAKLDTSLVIYHTGRRAHKIGWPRLLFQWFANSVSMMTHGKSYSTEWKPIR